MDNGQKVITQQLVEKKVDELVAMGLPPSILAIELVTRASMLMVVNCPAELARPVAEQMWKTVTAGLQQAGADNRLLPGVLPFSPANSA